MSNQIEYMAILNTENLSFLDKTESGYDIEFLYQSPEGIMRDYSIKIALQENVEQVILCYKPVMSNDYQFCKEELRKGNITPNDITQLLD